MGVSFDKYKGAIKKDINVDYIMANQDLIFFTYLGHYPNRAARLHSPFRKDTSAGCRFEYKDIWWFVDNATYKGKLYFNCIELVQYMYDLSFKEACLHILDHVNLNLNKRPTLHLNNPKINTNIEIKFLYKPFEDNHHFIDTLQLGKDFLEEEPVYNVERYWCNTKADGGFKMNRFYNPKDTPVIAYYFPETKHTKLYFIEQHHPRWYTNCSSTKDIYGIHRIYDTSKPLFICSSGKDELVLHYHYKVNTIAFQSETIKNLPQWLIDYIKSFSESYIWFDADKTGIENSIDLASTLDIKYKTHDINDGKDITELFINNNLQKYV
jgi:hypothetical protein